MLQKEVEQGFIYVPHLCDALKKYENSRNEYNTIEEYYPVLLKEFTKDIK